MNVEFFENRQWTNFLRSLDEGPNIVRFRSIKDLDTCRSLVSYYNVRSKTTRIHVYAYRQQMVVNFLKVRKDTPADSLTADEAILLERLRSTPLPDLPSDFMSGFHTAEARKRAEAMLLVKKTEE